MKEYGELRLGQERIQRNPTNGRFLKGSTPYNKGKTWDEMGIGKRTRERMKKGWANLDKHRKINGHLYGGRNKKRIVAIDDAGNWTIFSSLADAREKMQCNRENVRRCCQANSRGGYLKPIGHHDGHYIGLRWYYETDTELWQCRINKPLPRKEVV